MMSMLVTLLVIFLIGTYTALSKLESRNGNSEKAIEYALESKNMSMMKKEEIETDFS